MPQYFMFKFFEMPHFSYLILKMRNSSILGHFKKLWKCYHVKKSSFTCFLGHLMVPPPRIFLDFISRKIPWCSTVVPLNMSVCTEFSHHMTKYWLQHSPVVADTIFISTMNGGTAIYTALVIFSILGFKVSKFIS